MPRRDWKVSKDYGRGHRGANDSVDRNVTLRLNFALNRRLIANRGFRRSTKHALRKLRR